MAELILEILSEEIPARMQRNAADQLREKAMFMLKESALYHKNVKTYVTPRRLVLLVDGLSLTQEDSVVEKRGPRVDAPEQAIDGFLKSTGLKKEQLTVKETDKGSFYFAITEQKGKGTQEVLQDSIEAMLPTISWPKSMRWNGYDISWVRPINNLACVFGGETLPITFGHLEANNTSTGHRFLSQGDFVIKDFAQYTEELALRYVVLDRETRMRSIVEQVEKIHKDTDLKVLADEALLEEVAGLVEWPNVLQGNIDKKHMELPDEVLVSSIRTHQKYFCTQDDDGKLAPAFMVVANMKAKQDSKAIVEGNERVLRARLSDATFFFAQDQKEPLENKADQLERLVFHAKLGTTKEKSERVRDLAVFLAVWVPHAKLTQVERASQLCKADLVTEMVGEFPELQGQMGYYYALSSGEEKEVAEAIRDHYMPAGQDGACPTQPVSVAVALADKMDNLCGLFAVGEQPTGSKDPFALRRAALGIIRIILENNLSIPLRLLIDTSLKLYPRKLFKEGGSEEEAEEPKKGKKGLLKRKKKKARKPSEVSDELLVFFEERIKALLKAEGVRHDLISAVFDGGQEDDILRLVRRVAALDNFLKTEDGENLLAAYKRANNIVKKEAEKDGKTYNQNPSKGSLEQPEEQRLFTVLKDTEGAIEKLAKDEKYEEAMQLLATLRAPVDAFFEHVTVNSENEDLRQNRLRLLSKLVSHINTIANFSKIEG